MSLRDKHDTRLFRHYAKFTADGATFIGIVEYVSTKDIPASNAQYLDVTPLIAHDFTGSTFASIEQALDAFARG